VAKSPLRPCIKSGRFAGDGIQLVKACRQRQPDCKKDAELAGGAEQEDLGILQQRAEVRHCGDTDKNEQGEKLVGYAHVINGPQESFFFHQAGQRDVDQDGPEADGTQQQRLDIFFDTQVQQQAPDWTSAGCSRLLPDRSIRSQLLQACYDLAFAVLVGAFFLKWIFNQIKGSGICSFFSFFS
jgi:hypothetical protein